MKVSAWNNGAYYTDGNGYGIRIGAADRHKHFQKGWAKVNLILLEGPAPVVCRTDKKTFWKAGCGELINKEIGRWLIGRNLGAWPKNAPPALALIPLHDNWFVLA
jgi:hypothetical protein